MKVRIKGNPITPYGDFRDGAILTDAKYPKAFLLHLVNDANAADLLDYETKLDPAPVKKSPQSLPSSGPDKVLQKKTPKKPTKKQKS